MSNSDHLDGLAPLPWIITMPQTTVPHPATRGLKFEASNANMSEWPWMCSEPCCRKFSNKRGSR
jgi:hypothetical protein